jgi:FkbM family methyltransferase
MKITTKFGFNLTLRDGSYMASEFASNQCYEEPESRLVLSLVRPGDFCIDAGAHVGYYSCLMAMAGAKVLAIEPNPMHFAMLDGNVSNYPSILVSTDALGEIDSAPEGSPFYLPTEWDDGCGTLYPVRNNAKQINVPVARLDSILRLTTKSFGLPNGQRIRILKLDVEGSELAALRGLGERLPDVDYILIECGEYYAAKTIGLINQCLEGWNVKGLLDGRWDTVPKATTGNFLFTNPKIL